MDALGRSGRFLGTPSFDRFAPGPSPVDGSTRRRAHGLKLYNPETAVGRTEREKPSEKDVKEWASTESTMNKYRERYKEEWKAKLSEVVAKMIEKL